jgi:hypothetical protein
MSRSKESVDGIVMMNSPTVQGNAKWCAGEATKLLEAMGNRWTEWLATLGGMNRILIEPVPKAWEAGYGTYWPPSSDLLS